MSQTRAEELARRFFGGPPPRPQSDRREAIVAFVKQYTATHGYSPTMREVGAATGLASPSSVHSQLHILREDGRVTFSEKIARSLRVVEK